MKEAPSSTVPVPGTCWHKAPESIQYHGAINRTFSQLWCQLLATKSSDREKGCQDAWICAAPSTALFRRRHLEAWRKKRKGGDAVRCMGGNCTAPPTIVVGWRERRASNSNRQRYLHQICIGSSGGSLAAVSL